MPSFQERLQLGRIAVPSPLLWLAGQVPLKDLGPEAGIELVDDATRRCLQSVLPGSRLTDSAFAQACLPEGYAGLKLIRLADHADARFVSMHLKCMAVVPSLAPHLAHMFADPRTLSSPTACAVVAAHQRLVDEAPVLAQILDFDNPDPRPGLVRAVQRELETVRAKKIYNALPDVNSKSFFHAAAGDKGSFTALPTCPSNTWSNQQYHSSICRRLGLPIPSCLDNAGSVACHMCLAPGALDPFGNHCDTCTKDGQRERTELIHDPIRNEVGKMMRAARLPNVSIEPKGFLNKNGKRPDVACSSWPWSGGTTGTRAIDVVTICSCGVTFDIRKNDALNQHLIAELALGNR